MTIPTKSPFAIHAASNAGYASCYDPWYKRIGGAWAIRLTAATNCQSLVSFYDFIAFEPFESTRESGSGGRT